MTHYGIEHGYDSEDDAQQAEPEMMAKLLKLLRSDGYVAFSAPPLPTVSRCRARAEGGCRVMSRYVLPWEPSQWAGQFVVRVDTLAAK